MRGGTWLFWFTYLGTAAMLPYTLMNMLDSTWLLDTGWLVLVGWIVMSALQWCLFLMGISYRKIVR